MFRHRMWMSTAAYYVGLLALANLIFSGQFLTYAPYLLLLQLIGGLTISVGYHRLFCHGSFRVSRPWQVLFALLGVAYAYGSPLQWDVTHSMHHKHSDTDRDPHFSGWRAIASKGYRAVPLDLWRSRKLLRSFPALHSFVDKYCFGLWMLFAGSLALISPTAFVYVYLPALGIAHLVGGLHTMLSHADDKPRNLWFMELLLPAGGEWLHGTHHEKPGRRSFRTKWFHIDPGAAVIKWISKRVGAV